MKHSTPKSTGYHPLNAREASRHFRRERLRAVVFAALLTASAVTPNAVPAAHADNKRLNDSVVSSIYTVQRQAGCTGDLRVSPPLRLAAQWHAVDVLNHRDLNFDVGSDGSGPQDRSKAAGYGATPLRPLPSTPRWRSAASS
jgi:hypothetical protein